MDEATTIYGVKIQEVVDEEVSLLFGDKGSNKIFNQDEDWSRRGHHKDWGQYWNVLIKIGSLLRPLWGFSNFECFCYIFKNNIKVEVCSHVSRSWW